MKMPILALFAAAALLIPAAHADEPAIIAKARAYLAPESAFAAMQTLHFTGKYVQSNVDFPDDRTKDVTRSVEIFFEKPSRERIVVTVPGKVIETAVDGYDGWQRTRDPADPTSARRVLLGAEVTENLRADTWENLYFYRGIERVGGRVEDDGAAIVDGVACEKVAFIHSPTIVYFRYFDQATGRLVVTATAAGVTIREKGELISGGIRFPRQIITRQSDSTGGMRTSTYTFDSVAVNESMPDSFFTVPLSATAP
jgi:outer membrane lipoprotein-sorting protein